MDTALDDTIKKDRTMLQCYLSVFKYSLCDPVPFCFDMEGEDVAISVKEEWIRFNIKVFSSCNKKDKYKLKLHTFDKESLKIPYQIDKDITVLPLENCYEVGVLFDPKSEPQNAKDFVYFLLSNITGRRNPRIFRVLMKNIKSPVSDKSDVDFFMDDSCLGKSLKKELKVKKNKPGVFTVSVIVPLPEPPFLKYKMWLQKNPFPNDLLFFIPTEWSILQPHIESFIEQKIDYYNGAFIANNCKIFSNQEKNELFRLSDECVPFSHAWFTYHHMGIYDLSFINKDDSDFYAHMDINLLTFIKMVQIHVALSDIGKKKNLNTLTSDYFKEIYAHNTCFSCKKSMNLIFFPCGHFYLCANCKLQHESLWGDEEYCLCGYSMNKK